LIGNKNNKIIEKNCLYISIFINIMRIQEINQKVSILVSEKTFAVVNIARSFVAHFDY